MYNVGIIELAIFACDLCMCQTGKGTLTSLQSGADLLCVQQQLFVARNCCMLPLLSMGCGSRVPSSCVLVHRCALSADVIHCDGLLDGYIAIASLLCDMFKPCLVGASVALSCCAGIGGVAVQVF